MSGVYGEIDSRADFERVLREAAEIAHRVLKLGRNSIMEAIVEQLDAIGRWTSAGRAPSEGERKEITVGLIAVRELDADGQDDAGVLARKLYVLDSYFTEWPTDEQVRNATDADFWRRFGL